MYAVDFICDYENNEIKIKMKKKEMKLCSIKVIESWKILNEK